MLSRRNFQPGDLIYTRFDLFNDDGGIPDVAPGELLAPAGARGVIVNAGYAEANPELSIYLVRFEGADKQLGLPIGCLVDELTEDEASTSAVASASDASEPCAP